MKKTENTTNAENRPVWTSCPEEQSRVCVTWSPVNELSVECTENDKGVKEYKLVNDVALLFNQQRLENLGVDTAKDWLSNIQARLSAPLKEVPKLTDTQLLQFIKSKHIQTPSELMSWSKYLDNEVQSQKQQAEDEKTFNSNLAKLRARIFGDEEKKDKEKKDGSSSE